MCPVKKQGLRFLYFLPSLSTLRFVMKDGKVDTKSTFLSFVGGFSLYKINGLITNRIPRSTSCRPNIL